MKFPISIQLYSLREESARNFENVLKRIAAMGYRGVEPAGLYGIPPVEFKRRVEDLGMTISSSHTPWVTPESIEESAKMANLLGLDKVCTGFGPDHFNTRDSIQRTADIVNHMCAKLKMHGLKLFIHNHQWEFCEVDGALAYDHFISLVPDLLFEIDAYWASNFGKNDPAKQILKFRSRMPLLHIKDGFLLENQSNVPLGSGKMDIPRVIAAADPDVLEWIIVEFDHCDTDMFSAVEKSYHYLTSQGLAVGLL
ncbi:sugar phosphate isomerase/epimerase [Oscillatoria laete-virens NRMC-F 0139]|nr:sugar phosphate isomerase/epimerase [Oscillatoria laete-virens]MDL5055362.1 sugar phosphate isomerase/epimerase [Oscillatoria laete-virens NRMC-F 0139]